MQVYDILIVDDSDPDLISNKFLVATVFDLDYANFIVDISNKVYEFPFELSIRELNMNDS